MLNMQNYETILSTLWFDKLKVERLEQVIDDVTGVTETEEFSVIMENVKCRISFPMADNPTVPYTANEVNRQIKLFTYYNLDIQAGDRCTVTRVDRDGITPLRTYTGLVGESNLYRGHKEIMLENVDYITEGKF